jgi:pimeloyl-ACP methyl ester carboxylesterase
VVQHLQSNKLQGKAMSVVVNDGVPIFYKTKGEGEPIFMLHGFTSSYFQWEIADYAESLAKTYRVVLMDTRGHGQSGKPYSYEAYDLSHRLADIKAVLDALNIESAHFLGYSMGGWLSFAMAVHYPERVRSLIAGGAHPYAESMSVFRHENCAEPSNFIAAMSAFIGEPISDTAKSFILKNDLTALCAAATDRHDQMTQLKALQLPSLFFTGELDKRRELIVQAAEELGAPEVLIIPKANHATALYSTHKILPHIGAFLSSMSQRG